MLEHVRIVRGNNGDERTMKWNKFRLTTTTESEDLVSSMLMDLGIQGIEIEDKIPMSQLEKEQMFVDILPVMAQDDGVAYIDDTSILKIDNQTDDLYTPVYLNTIFKNGTSN